MRKQLGVAAATVVASVALAAPASAHIIEVKNPSTGKVVREGWVGGGGAAHVHGLVTACSSERSDWIMIYTNWNPTPGTIGCTHFGPGPSPQ